MTRIRYAWTMTLVEDLHCGSGLGGSGIDALVARDRHGQPTIRWSHLKGLLRDSLRERQASLARSESETTVLANALFGHDGLGSQALSQRHALVRLADFDRSHSPRSRSRSLRRVVLSQTPTQRR